MSRERSPSLRPSAVNGDVGHGGAAGADKPHTSLGTLLLAEVFARVQDALLVLDTNDLVSAANPAAEALLHVRPGALLGMSLVKLLPVSAPLLALIVAPDRAGPLQLEVELVRPQGGVVPAAVSAFRVEDGRTVLVCRALPTKPADSRASRAERRFRVVVERSSDVFFVIDAHGRIDYASPTAVALGLVAGEHRELDLWRIVHPRDREAAQTALASRYDPTKGPLNNVNTVVRVRVSGAWRWFDVTATDLSDDPDVRGLLVQARDGTASVMETRRLRSSEAYYRAIFERSNQGLVLLDRHRRLQRVNYHNQSSMGYRDSELLGTNQLDLVHPDDQAALSDAFDMVEARLGATEEVRFRVRDVGGTYHWLEGSVSNLLHDPNIGAFILSYRRVGDRVPVVDRIRSLNDELKRRLSHLQSLRRIDMAINNSVDVKLVFDIFMTQVVQDLGIDAVGVLLYDPQLHALRPAMGLGFTSELRVRARVDFGVGPAGVAGMEQRSVYLPDLRGEDGWGAAVEPEHQVEYSSYMAVPMVAKGQLQGVIELYSKRPMETSAEWLEFLETYADQGAIAVENSQLVRSLERSNQELRRAYGRTIEGWASSLDLKDEETAGHSKRVTDMTVRLSRRLNVASDELVHIQRGALLHDIGKMGIPDQILLKRGPLTSEEFDFMRKHPVFAYELLSPIEFLRPALDIPYCHHEKWDGSGYPRGLKGEQIPLAARIFAVVDVFDALTSERPYREAWPVDRAAQFIRDGSGTHFDPAVVEAFFEMLDHESRSVRHV
ncbi:MAG TPA: PAS domain S-box protein [Trueperaceae bacterium]|nr:PAS domain S-box protein [Trueperaceae bacterium]